MSIDERRSPLPILAPRTQLIAFLVSLLFVGLSLAGTFVVLGGDWGSEKGRVLITTYSVAPGFIAVILKALFGTKSTVPSAPAVLGFRVAFGWMLFGWLAAFIVAIGLSFQFTGDASGRWWMTGSSAQFMRAMASGPTLMALFALGQELGFRGFFLGTLQEEGRLRPKAMLLASTAVWTVWTTPITIGMSESLTAAFWTICWTAIAGWFLAELRLHSRSVLPTATFWGTYTALSAALPAGVTNGAKPLVLMLILAGTFSLGARAFRRSWLRVQKLRREADTSA